MESVLAWADCAPDLNTSIGVTAALQPSEQQVGGPHVNCLCTFSHHILTIKEKAVHTCATHSEEYMKYSVKDLEGWETHCEFSLTELSSFKIYTRSVNYDNFWIGIVV